MATKTKKVQVVGISADDLGVVSYDVAQNLTDEQKVQAKENIGVDRADWNENDSDSISYVRNRTHYEDMTVITWDGSKDSVTSGSFAPGFYLCQLSDKVLSSEDLVGAQVTLTYTEDQHTETIIVASDNIEEHVSSNTLSIVHPDDGLTLFQIYQDDTRTGVYVGWGDGLNRYVSEIVCGTVHQLDPKYIPTPTDDEMLNALIEADMLMAVTDTEGAILTDEKGQIIMW